jgi:hypothetical protein
MRSPRVHPATKIEMAAYYNAASSAGRTPTTASRRPRASRLDHDHVHGFADSVHSIIRMAEPLTQPGGAHDPDAETADQGLRQYAHPDRRRALREIRSYVATAARRGIDALIEATTGNPGAAPA